MMGNSEVTQPKGWLGQFSRWCKSLCKAGGGVAAAAIFVATMLIFFDVIMRYVFNRPTIWVMEIVIFLFSASVFLGLGYTELVHGHVNVDLIYRRFPKIWQKRTQAVVTIISLAYIGFLIWSTALFTWKSYIYHVMSRWFLPISLTPIYILMPIGASLLFFQILFGVLKSRKE